jgi:hypothetical protein
VVVYPVIGLLAVGCLVFALLWLFYPLAGGPGEGPSGRRIEIRTGKRLLRIADGLNPDGPNAGFETRLPGDEFDERTKLLVGLTRAIRTGEQASEFFQSEAGRQAQPAVVLTFPQRGATSEALDVYAADLRRQAVYCRLKSTGEELAIKLDEYQKVAAGFAQLAGGAAGSLAAPYVMSLDDALRSRLAKLLAPLLITSVSSDPRQQFVQTLGSPLAAMGGLQFQQPDAATLLASLRLPDDQAMARALADAMGRASEKVKVQHLDLATQAQVAQVRQFALALKRSVNDIEDSLVLQYGGRVRVLRGAELLAREETGPLVAPGQVRFEGEKVLARALDDLLSERGLLYFAEGHGERRMGDRRNEGLTQVAEHLSSRGFRAAPLDFASAKAVPADCQALVIPGPRKPLEADVEKAINAYLDGGGRLALLLDPPDGIVPLADTLKRYGITVPDPKKVIQIPGLNPPVAVELELNAKLDFVAKWTREATIFYPATELVVAPPAEGAAFEVLRVARPAEADEGAKPPCLIAAVRPKAGTKGPKLLVLSDVDAFSNQLVRQVATNAQLLSDALGWLAE